jgi:tetratricopeptide (TPR) repeat protein
MILTIVPVRLEGVIRGTMSLTSMHQYKLYDNLEVGLDNLAVALGGSSLADQKRQDTRSHYEKIIQSLTGSAETLFYATEKAISLDPDHPATWNLKGSALGYLGHYSEALDAYEKSLELNPDLADAWYNKGLELENLGRHKEAEQAFTKARTLDFKLD